VIARPVLKERRSSNRHIDSNTQYRYCKQIAVKPSAGSVLKPTEDRLLENPTERRSPLVNLLCSISLLFPLL